MTRPYMRESSMEDRLGEWKGLSRTFDGPKSSTTNSLFRWTQMKVGNESWNRTGGSIARWNEVPMLARCRCDDFNAVRGAEWRGERGKEGIGEL